MDFLSTVPFGPLGELASRSPEVVAAIAVATGAAVVGAAAAIHHWVTGEHASSGSRGGIQSSPWGKSDLATSRLFWNSRFPDNPEMARTGDSEPTRVIVGNIHVLETALETTAAEGAATTVIPSSAVVGTDVVFSVQGSGISFSTVSRTGPFFPDVHSDPLRCSHAGTPVFRVWCRIDTQGDVLVECDLMVNNTMIVGREFRLLATPADKLSGERPIVRKQQSVTITASSTLNKDEVERLALRRIEASLAETLRQTRGEDGNGTIESLDALNSTISTDLQLQVRPRRYEGQDWCGVVLKLPKAPKQTARTRKKKRDLNGKASEHRVSLEELSKEYKPAGSGVDFALDPDYAEKVTLKFAQIGRDLHGRIFASDFSTARSDADDRAKSMARDISLQGRGVRRRPTMQIVAPELSIPWALLYDDVAYDSSSGKNRAQRRELNSADQVDLNAFWGRRFNIFHFVKAVGAPRTELSRGAVRMQPILDTLLEPDIVEKQRELFTASVPAPVRFNISDALIDRMAFIEWVKRSGSQPCEIVYFFCHGSVPTEYDTNLVPENQSHAGKAKLSIATDSGARGWVTVDEMQEAWGYERTGRPLVMLNACSSTFTDPMYGAPFVEHFLRCWRGRALLGTEWSVHEIFADQFSRRVLAELRAKKTLIGAIESASEAAFEQHNLFPLIYSLYGLPNIRAQL